MRPHDQNHTRPPSSDNTERKRTSQKVTRLGVFLRGAYADQLLALALKHDTQPGRIANRLLRDALDLAARGGQGA